MDGKTSVTKRTFWPTKSFIIGFSSFLLWLNDFNHLVCKNVFRGSSRMNRILFYRVLSKKMVNKFYFGILKYTTLVNRWSKKMNEKTHCTTDWTFSMLHNKTPKRETFPFWCETELFFVHWNTTEKSFTLNGNLNWNSFVNCNIS